MRPPGRPSASDMADAAHVSSWLTSHLELGLPAWAAELRLDLLVKINSKLPGENGGGNHDFGELVAYVVRSAETEALVHGPPQALQTFARAFCQTQSGIGQSVLAVTIPETIG